MVHAEPKAVMPVLSVAEQIAVREPVLKPISEYKPIRGISLCVR